MVSVPGRNPFHVGNKPRSVDINVFHDRTGHLSDPILTESAGQQGITLTGRMEAVGRYVCFSYGVVWGVEGGGGLLVR